MGSNPERTQPDGRYSGTTIRCSVNSAMHARGDGSNLLTRGPPDEDCFPVNQNRAGCLKTLRDVTSGWPGTSAKGLSAPGPQAGQELEGRRCATAGVSRTEKVSLVEMVGFGSKGTEDTVALAAVVSIVVASPVIGTDRRSPARRHWIRW